MCPRVSDLDGEATPPGSECKCPSSPLKKGQVKCTLLKSSHTALPGRGGKGIFSCLWMSALHFSGSSWFPEDDSEVPFSPCTCICECLTRVCFLPSLCTRCEHLLACREGLSPCDNQDGKGLSSTFPSVPLATTGHDEPTLPAWPSLFYFQGCGYCLTWPWEHRCLPNILTEQQITLLIKSLPVFISTNSRGKVARSSSEPWPHSDL